MQTPLNTGHTLTISYAQRCSNLATMMEDLIVHITWLERFHMITASIRMRMGAPQGSMEEATVSMEEATISMEVTVSMVAGHAQILTRLPMTGSIHTSMQVPMVSIVVGHPPILTHLPITTSIHTRVQVPTVSMVIGHAQVLTRLPMATSIHTSLQVLQDCIRELIVSMEVGHPNIRIRLPITMTVIRGTACQFKGLRSEIRQNPHIHLLLHNHLVVNPKSLIHSVKDLQETTIGGSC